MSALRALRSAGRDFVVAFFAAGAVFALVFWLGRLTEPPKWLPTAGAVYAGTETPTTIAGETSIDPAVVVPGLQAIVDDLFGFGAAASATGAIDGRLIFGQVDHFSISCAEEGCGEGVPAVLSIAYVGDKSKLTVIATVPSAGTEFTEGVTPVLAVGAQSFIAHSGDCTMTLSTFGWGGEAGRFAQQQADIDGQMTCVDVADVRSGDTISYTAVFVLHTLEEVPP